MVKRKLIVKKKAKHPRITRNEAYLVNFKYLGDEPEFNGEITQTDYNTAINWYNMMCTTADAREYINDYFKANNDKDKVKLFARVPDIYVPTTAAWICRIQSRGALISERSVMFKTTQLEECLLRAKNDEPKENSAPKVSIQDRMRERAYDIIGEIEHLIDTEPDLSLYDWLKTNETPAMYAPIISGHYAGWLAELIEAYEGKDEQLKEAYKHLTKKELKERIMFFHRMTEDAEKYAGVAKKIRVPKKPRAVSAAKKLKSFKFKKEDNEFKIASINPEKILGAQELWAFNTKTKTLSVFRAIDRGGLQVKGTSIINFDEKASVTKKTGRKPEIYIEKVINGGKIVLRKLMEEIKTSAPLQERINENTILLKVV
jgi:hypothetical protein